MTSKMAKLKNSFYSQRNSWNVIYELHFRQIGKLIGTTFTFKYWTKSGPKPRSFKNCDLTLKYIYETWVSI